MGEVEGGILYISDKLRKVKNGDSPAGLNMDSRGHSPWLYPATTSTPIGVEHFTCGLFSFSPGMARQ